MPHDIVSTLIQKTQLSRIPIAVIGDGMKDVYINGTFGACQEGCYKFAEYDRIVVGGGAFNAAACLKTWNVLLSSQYCRGLTTKTRHLVGGRYVFRHDEDVYMGNEEAAKIRASCLAFLRDFKPKAVLVSDYDKGLITNQFVEDIWRTVSNGVPIVIDAKRHHDFYDVGKNIILKCNSDYARRFEVDSALALPRHGFFGVISTHGGEPPFVNGNELDLDLPPVNVVNHVGAGDCFAAILTLALAHGGTLKAAATVAHHAARVYVQHPYNRAPWPHEVRKDAYPQSGKLFIGNLADLRKSLDGRLAVWTNGVYRIPHAGHAWGLDWAKKQGDVLIVGVNTDESAWELRDCAFCMPLEQRVAMLTSMASVDWVVPFAGQTPFREITQLRPDVIVKGSEYEGKPIPGSECVSDVRFAPRSPFDLSATGIEEQIMKRN